MELRPVSDQVVVVMGASSGIGRDVAQRFAARGARVVLSARDADALAALAAEIRAGGGEATCCPADVAVFEQVRSVADFAVARYGRLDTWVHLAGVGLWSRVDDMRPEEWDRVIAVNLSGQAYGAMAALPHLRAQGRGKLIHVSSLEAATALPLQSAYAASKHGVRGFVRALRMELQSEGSGIDVTEVLPSGINTPLFDTARTHIGVKPRPLPPMYEPEVVSDAILYAAEHRTEEVVAGGGGKLAELAQRYVPRLWMRALVALAPRLQRTAEAKGEGAPDNLFHPAEGPRPAHGTFGGESRRVSLYTWSRTHPLAAGAVLALGIAAFAALASRGRGTTPDHGAFGPCSVPADDPAVEAEQSCSLRAS
ncbi:MAG: SDR family oxidoreductase [Armatimonadota bacterium]